MTDDDRWLEIAGLILDGNPVDWEAIPGGRPAEDASADGLRVIADVAAMHRASASERRWGTLAIHEQIGHGTFGDVYRARDTTLDRDVALKLVDYTSSSTTPDEGRLLARLRHSNVVTVYGAAIHDGRYGIWMEFIRGGTLAAIVREKGPLAIEDVTAIGIDVCRALTAVHESGLLHGDVKAQNVMREESGRIVVMDFGTGRVARAGAPGDKLAGTPLYLAPEVLAGAAPDVRADVYSAGVLLYYLLTGAHPVEGSTLDDVRAAHASETRTSVRSRRPEIPRPLGAIIERAIAVEPSDRFESAAAFERALRESVAKRARAFNKRLVALASVGILIAALGGGLWVASMTADWNSKIYASVLYQKSYNFGTDNDWKSALALVNDALVADDTSGIAHAWKAWCLQKTSLKRSDAAIAEAKRALDISSTSEWERLWIEATYDDFTNQTDREVAALTELVKLRPNDSWVVSTLADRLHELGRAREALPYYVQGAELGSRNGPFIIRTATEVMAAGRPDLALRYAVHARALVGMYGWFQGASSAWTLPIEADWRRGDLRGAAAALDAARAECTRLDGRGRTELTWSLVNANLSLGRSRAATAVAELMANQNLRHFSRAAAAFHGGYQQSMQKEMSQNPDDPNPLSGDESLAFYLIEAGLLREAEVRLGLPLWLPKPDRGAAQVDRGVLALARGDRAQALAFLRDARPFEIHAQSIYRFEYLADIYVQQQDWARAIATLEDSLQYRSAPFQALWWMRNELRLAELYHTTGRDADARPLEAHLEQLLMAADPDFPLLVRLKALERQTQLP